jgi:hypothetical protein
VSVPKDDANSLRVLSNSGAPLTKLLTSCCTNAVVAISLEEFDAVGTPPKWTLSIIELDFNLINGISYSLAFLNLVPPI